MRKSLLFLSALIFGASVQAQLPACASSYDTDFNNDYTPTHYFPGPMPIPFNTNINGRIDVGTDRDYYKFTVTNGGTITMTLTNLPANYNLNLVNSQGASIATSARSGTSNETINFTAASNTVYFALVYPANKRTFNANACYTLRVSTGTASRQAKEMIKEVTIFPNPTGDFANLSVPEVKGVMQVRVLNGLGSVVHRQNATQQLTALRLNSLRSGIYFVEVYGVDGGLLYRSRLVKK